MLNCGLKVRRTAKKNPECDSVQDFYFLPITSSLFTKTVFRIILESKNPTHNEIKDFYGGPRTRL